MKKQPLLFALVLVLALASAHLVTAAGDVVYSDEGASLGRLVINGPPEPPPGARRPVPSANQLQTAHILANVPASSWAFGCSATSASMIAGYHDRTAYPNMYTGPTDGGVFPLTNSIWGTTVISGENRALNPLSATRDGLDGRSGFGHVDDFWVSLDPGDADDPYITGGWTAHTYGDCTGDFMKTSQSAFFNNDGWTTFHSYTEGHKTTADNLEAENAHGLDGGYGFMLFVRSRGYGVANQNMYNQLIDGYPGTTTQGFTWDDYKAQIDNGNPVMIHLAGPSSGHTVVGLGYDDTGQTAYIHDTWDHALHTMTWGGSYGGLDHQLVTVVEIDPPPACTTHTQHTVIVDGALEDWCRDTEQLEVDRRPASPVPGDQELLLTWDSSNIYLGWGGADLDTDGDLWFYFYSRGGQGSMGSVGGAHLLPPDSDGSGADHALLVSGADPPTYTFYDWTSSWSPDVSFTGVVSVTGDQTEIKIPKIQLGMLGREALALLAFAEGKGGDVSWASFPTGNAIGTQFCKVYQWLGTGVGNAPNDHYILVDDCAVYLPIVVRE